MNITASREGWSGQGSFALGNPERLHFGPPKASKRNTPLCFTLPKPSTAALAFDSALSVSHRTRR